MTTVERVTGLTVAAAAVIGMVALSHAPLARDGTAGGLLRLAWRARPEKIENCRELSADALAALPPHMRQSVVCEGANASYRLEVSRGGVVLADVAVRPGGLRRDRPLYVFQEMSVPVGDADISVRFTRIDAPDRQSSTDERTARDLDVARRRDELTETIPASLSYAERLHFAPGQVHVISYDPARHLLFDVMP